MSMPTSVAGFLTSALLAALTLTVFHRNQMAGPEAALVNYFVAVSRGDRAAAAEIVDGTPEEVLQLEHLATSLMRMPAQPIILDVTRNEDMAMAAVVFVARTGVQIPWAWRLVQLRGSWYIDARGTLQQFRVPSL